MPSLSSIITRRRTITQIATTVTATRATSIRNGIIQKSSSFSAFHAGRSAYTKKLINSHLSNTKKSVSSLASLSSCSFLRSSQCSAHQHNSILKCNSAFNNKKEALSVAAKFSTTSSSSSSKQTPIKNVRVLWGSQTGTGRLFASDLVDEIQGDDEFEGGTVDLESLNDEPPLDLLTKKDVSDEDALIFIMACAGVGQPTDNARDFYQYLMDDQNTAKLKNVLKGRPYGVFGLGNSETHAENYNRVGKTVDKRLFELGGQRLIELGLGDDSDCIEDDFELWTQTLLEHLKTGTSTFDGEGQDSTTSSLLGAVDEERVDDESTSDGGVCFGELEQQRRLKDEASGTQKSSEQISSTKDESTEEPTHIFPRLVLKEPMDTDLTTSKDRWTYIHTTPNMLPSYYLPNTTLMNVCRNERIASSREGMYEMLIDLNSSDSDYQTSYVAGDHMWIYGENHPTLIEAYAKAVDAQDQLDFVITDIDRNDNKATKKRTYPYPLGLTLRETLKYCVDLSAVPSVSMCRSILGHDTNFDYKNDINETRMTTLELLLQNQSEVKLSLSDLLYQLPPMQPRYYSIASSPIGPNGPHKVLLAYRPVEYVTTRGVRRVGTCTNYMTKLKFIDSKMNQPLMISGGLRHNPEFRLPSNKRTPLLLIAGGCGIAPIRAFLEERLSYIENQGLSSADELGPAYLFFGVRNSHDMVYEDLMKEAVQKGALTEVILSFSSEHKMVSDSLKETKYQTLCCDLLQNQGAHIYLCGGAGGFAPSCTSALKDSLRTYGNISNPDEFFMRELIEKGRYAEDVSS